MVVVVVVIVSIAPAPVVEVVMEMVSSGISGIVVSSSGGGNRCRICSSGSSK